MRESQVELENLQVQRCTWRRKVQLHLPQLHHGDLQLLDDQVVAVEERLSDSFLKKLSQLLQRHLQQPLCEEQTAG